MAMQPSRLEANWMYWDTDSSVGQIAEYLGVSRRALYELLEPTPADAACPGCGSPLLFTNRLARAAGDAVCATCGNGTRLAAPPRASASNGNGVTTSNGESAVRSRRASQAATAEESAEMPPPEGHLPEWTSPIGIRRHGLTGELVAIAALGLAAGIAVGLIVRRRHR